MRFDQRVLMPLVLLVTLAFLVSGAVRVVAQDESPAPDPVATLAGSDFEGIFPSELGGLPWDDHAISIGEENIDEQDDEGRARFGALLTALDASIDDVTMVSASRMNEDFTEFAFIVAIRVAGTEPDLLLEETLMALDDFTENPRVENAQVAGKDVVLLFDDDSPESQPVHFYASGDTVWYVIAMEPELTEAFDHLP